MYQREDLIRELDALQDSYNRQKKIDQFASNSSPSGAVAVKAAEERLASKLPPSRAERALQEIAEGKALQDQFRRKAEQDEQIREARGPEGIAQRKDGLDMSLHHLSTHASRMRTQLDEIGLQLNQAGRDRASQSLEQSRAVPRELQEEYRQQQKVMVEQKRLLTQLRHERQLAEDDQYWLHRKNRLDHDDNVVGKPGTDPSIPPEELLEAHRSLRETVLSSGRLGSPAPAAPPQDAYVYAEVFRVSKRQPRGTVAELCVVDKAGVTLARSLADFPDAPGETCRMDVTLPSQVAARADIVAELSLVGSGERKTVSVKLSELGDKPGKPANYDLRGDTPESNVSAYVDFARVLPQDSEGLRLESTRVVTDVRVSGRSALPPEFTELPPSEAHRRALKKEWDRNGRPDDFRYQGFEELHPLEKAATYSAPFADVPAQEEVLPPDSVPEQQGLLGLGGFFSGFEERRRISNPSVSSARSQGAEDIAADRRRSAQRSANRGFEERGPSQQDEGYYSVPSHGSQGLDGLAEAAESTAYDKAGQESAARRTSQATRRSARKKTARPYVESEESGQGVEQPDLPNLAFAAFAGIDSKDAPAEAHQSEETTQPEEGFSFLPSFSWVAPSLPFAAFAGEETQTQSPTPKAVPVQKGLVDASDAAEPQNWATLASNTEKSNKKAKLPLRPPHSVRNLNQLYQLLFAKQKDGALGQPKTGQDVLEFAARVSKAEDLRANLKEHERLGEGQAQTAMVAYASLLLDSLQQYADSSVLNLWITEALTTLFRQCSIHQQAEFSVPFFRAFASIARSFQNENPDDLHPRVLRGLAEVAGPDCRLEAAGIVDYTLAQLDRDRNRLHTLTTEHAFAILCVLKSPHRVSEQIKHCLLVIRGLKSDSHLCLRAMVTASELYGVVAEIIRKETAARAGTRNPLNEQERLVELGIPDEGVDVRLMATVLDLYPGHRKLAGAALRAFAAMARMSLEHLEEVAKREVRAMSMALAQQKGSRSVNLHIAEVIHLVADRNPEKLLSDTLIFLAGSVLMNSVRDSEIAVHILLSLDVFLKQAADQSQRGRPTHLHYAVAQSFPSDLLVKVGDVHHRSSTVIESLCSCITLQCWASRDVRNDFVHAGALAVPLRVFDEAEKHEASACRAAAETLKALIIDSKKAGAQVQFMDAGGPRLILNVLAKQQDDTQCVHAVLAALAAAAQFVSVRRAMVHQDLPPTLATLDRILRLAESHVETDPDVLSWACLSVGALTERQHEETQEILRKAIDRDVLQQIIDKTRAKYGFGFRENLDFCERLISNAANTDLSDPRVLDESGGVVHDLNPRVLAPVSAPKFQAEGVAAITEPVSVQGSWHEAFDVWAPLRVLGVGPGSQPDNVEVSDQQINALLEIPSAPIRQPQASYFLYAVQSEYFRQEQGAVQEFLDRRHPEGDANAGELVLSADEIRLLQPWVERMREADNKKWAYDEISTRWNVIAVDPDQQTLGLFGGIFSSAAQTPADPTPVDQTPAG